MKKKETTIISLQKTQQTIEPSKEDTFITVHPREELKSLVLSKIKQMGNTQIVGLVAGACTTIAFLPQVIKTWKTKTAKDLSLGMFSFFCFGVLLWLIYGIMMRDIPVIVANL